MAVEAGVVVAEGAVEGAVVAVPAVVAVVLAVDSPSVLAPAVEVPLLPFGVSLREAAEGYRQLPLFDAQPRAVEAARATAPHDCPPPSHASILPILRR